MASTGKGKKKNKADKKVPLDEFNQIDAPQGHSVVSVKLTGLDWAATMADYEQTAAETQQLIVPTAPRAQRGPAVDVDSLPNEPPFRVSLYNLPMSFEEKELADRIFQGLEIVRVETQGKTSTTVELASKTDLVEALCKDGTNFKGRTVNVCLYGQSPPNNHQDRYGGRGSSSFDRFGDRTAHAYSGSRSSDRYGDRQGGGGGGFGRDRDGGFGGFNRSGGFGQRGGYHDRYPDRGSFGDNRGSFGAGGHSPADEPANWRSKPTVKPPPPTPSYNNGGSRQLYTSSRSEPSSYQQPAPSQYPTNQESYHPPRYQHYNQPRNHSPHTPFNNQASSDSFRSAAPSTAEERPRIKLTMKKPLNLDDLSSGSRNEAIFGKAQPSSKPYEKMHEVEEKLSAVQLSDRKVSPQGSSQPGSQPGSAPRSRRVSERE